MAISQSLLSERLRSLRAARRMSQEALAEKAGRSIETVSNIERGTSSPTLETLDQLASALGVKTLDLLEEKSAGPAEKAVMRIIAAARSLEPKELEIAANQIEALVRLKG